MNDDFKLSNPDDKWAVMRDIKDQLVMPHGFIMDDVDELKPWGAYYRLDVAHQDTFLDLFFPELDKSQLAGGLSPKIMVFAPGKKISLQYHERRDEIWTVLYGEIEAWYGPEDELGEYKTYLPGESFSYPVGHRHKAGASANGWAIIAEIWRHTDPENPSAEEDNIRLSDDYGRA